MEEHVEDRLVGGSGVHGNRAAAAVDDHAEGVEPRRAVRERDMDLIRPDIPQSLQCCGADAGHASADGSRSYTPRIAVRRDEPGSAYAMECALVHRASDPVIAEAGDARSRGMGGTASCSYPFLDRRLRHHPFSLRADGRSPGRSARSPGRKSPFTALCSMSRLPRGALGSCEQPGSGELRRKLPDSGRSPVPARRAQAQATAGAGVRRRRGRACRAARRARTRAPSRSCTFR